MNAQDEGHQRRTVADAIRSADYVRTPSLPRLARGHKEWFHFAVSDEGLDVLVNFSFTTPRGPGPTVARVIWLAHTDRWHGDVMTPTATSVRARSGEVGAVLGESAFRFHDDAFRLTVRGRGTSMALDLVVVPEALPMVFHNIPAGGREVLHWFVAPRCRARGTLVIRGTKHRVDALAYHDHNWGRFSWGGNFGWEWGYAVEPGEPEGVAVVFSRMSDRAMHRTLRRGVLVWLDGVPTKLFRGDMIHIEHEGLLHSDVVPVYPSAMGLRLGRATDVPRRFTLSAQDGDDCVQLTMHPERVAIVAVPADGDEGCSRIHEAFGRVEVEGEAGRSHDIPSLLRDPQ